jgi:uncharacterized protein
MSRLVEQIESDLVTARKARETARTNALRMVKSALKNEQIEKGHELSDEEALVVIRRAVKQRLDSIEQFEKGGRADLVDKEKAELAFVDCYLPQAMSEEQVESIIREVIASTGATSKKDTGRVMKESMVRLKGQADGRKVQEIASRLLP